VLAFAATGNEPFGSGAASALLYRVVHAEPLLTGVSAELCNVLEACLQKNPADRPTPGALLATLSSLRTEQPALHQRLLQSRGQRGGFLAPFWLPEGQINIRKSRITSRDGGI